MVTINQRSFVVELAALELEVEEEGPSYLADLNKAPDFVDEPPVEIGEVLSGHYCSCYMLIIWKF
jgi:hypothetical protein